MYYPRFFWSCCYAFWDNSSIFIKLSAICETKFHYTDKIRPIDYVVDLSSNMQVCIICLNNHWFVIFLEYYFSFFYYS